MPTRIKVRRDTALNWTNNNPTLALGEIAYETDTLKLKFGNGSTAWNNLTYATSGSNGSTPYTLTTATSNTLGGIKIGSGLSIDGNGVVTASGGGTTLPSQTGNNGKYLTTDGSALSWGTVAGGGGSGLSARITASVTISSIGPLSASSATIVGFKSYSLLSIETSTASWVTIYSSTASIRNDWPRSILTDPSAGSGVLAEVITTQTVKILFTPAVIGFSSETTPTTNIPVKIYNSNTSTTQSITVTLTLLKLEE
jgi:hypothetical protein